MTTMNATMDVSANRAGDRTCTNDAPMCTINSSIISFVKDLVRCKTWAFLHEKLGISERTAKHRLAGTREFTAAELAVLLRQERGRELLVAIMGDAEPAWWVDFQRQMTINGARKKAARLQRELEETIHAVDENTATLARIETALAVSDEAFHRPHIDALRSVAGVSHRAGASPAKRR
jgi:hypothetical protein